MILDKNPQDPQLIFTDYDPESFPDYKLAANHVFPLPNIVVVEMLSPRSQTTSGILIPDMSLWTDDEDAIPGIEPSLGVVIGLGMNVEGLEYGDICVVRDGDGMEVLGFEAGEYEAKGPVRMYGLTIPPETDEGQVMELPWQESIFGVIRENIKYAKGANVLIRKNPRTTAVSGIELPDYIQERDGKATIIALGSDCKAQIFDPVTLEPRGLMEGDVICYDPRAQWSFVDDDDEDLAFLPEAAILTVIA